MLCVECCVLSVACGMLRDENNVVVLGRGRAGREHLAFKNNFCKKND